MFKASQEKLVLLDSTSAPPLMEFNFGMEKVSNGPMTSKAPPMEVKDGKPVTLVNLELLAMTKAPPRVFKLEADNSVNSLLETTLKVTPIWVTLSMFKYSKVLLMKPMDWLTLVNNGNSTSPAPKTVMLLAQINWSKVRAKSSPLEEIDKPLEILLIGESMETKLGLLLMLKTSTSFKLLKPSKEETAVSEMTMLSAEVKEVMTKLSMTGKATKEMEPTEVKESKDKVWMEVKFCNSKSPVISVKELALKATMSAEFSMFKSPSMTSTPFKVGLIKLPDKVKVPEMVLQEDKLSKSDWAVAEDLTVHEDGMEELEAALDNKAKAEEVIKNFLVMAIFFCFVMLYRLQLSCLFLDAKEKRVYWSFFRIMLLESV